MNTTNDGNDLAWRFVDLFVDEARNHLRGAAAQSEAWERQADPTAPEAFRRHTHSLRGMAGTLGLRPMAELAKALETRGLERFADDEVRRALGALAAVVEAVARGDAADDEHTAAILEDLHLAS